MDRRDVLRVMAAAVPAATAGACRRLEPASAPAREREVTQTADAQPTIEGAGVRLRRSLGTRALPLCDPFLMLDEFHSDNPDDYIRGFPSHPHRGFETVTYMIHGAVEHRDSVGNHGHLGPGSAQWMTAGRGIIHSEMPQQENGSMWGFQLWVNLPAVRKMIQPRYQDLKPAQLPELAVDDASVRLVAGEVHGHRGPVDGIVTAPLMLDVRVPARGALRQTLPPSHNAFVYVFEGAATIGAQRTRVTGGQIAVLGGGDVLTVRSETGARMLCLAGQPIGEPVARYGPFVMNTEEELRQAVEDYRTGRLVGG